MKKNEERPSAQESLPTPDPLSGRRKPLTPLSQVEANQQVKVVDIQGGWGAKRRLNQMGIHSGDLLTVVRHGALGGPILIKVHGFQLALGRGIASHIFVEEEVGE